MSKAKSAAARCYHDRVAQMPCALCAELGQEQVTATSVHHLRTGQGMSQRAGHWLVLPLCGQCHQGDSGIHGNRALWRIAGHDELSLLDRHLECVLS